MSPQATYQANQQPSQAPAATVPAPAPAVPATVPIPVPAPQVQYIPMPQVQQKSSLKETVIFGLIGAAGVTISFLLLRKLYKDFRSGVEEKKSLDTSSEANVAKQIAKALYDSWTGTDEEELRKILTAVKSQKEWKKIGTSFHTQYDLHLMTALETELSTTEFAEMNAIINSKPEDEGGTVTSELQIENWAKRLSAAVNLWYLNMFPATDEGAIQSVFMEIPSQSIFAKVAGKYESKFGTKLIDDLQGDMDDWQDYMKIIYAKPQY